jgi:dipeptidyl aminopeptidase/acylaminoacyl peptidase
MMTYLALQKSDLITTSVVGNGPTDLFSIIIDRPEMEANVYSKLIPDYKKNKKEELKKRAVVYWADELNKKSSLLILCSTNDKRVNPEQVKNIAEKLTDINYDFKLKEFETNHKFSGKTEELNKLLLNWFKDKL